MIQGPESQRSVTKLFVRFENRETLQVGFIGRRSSRRLTERRGGGRAHALRHCKQATSEFVMIRWWLRPKAKESVVFFRS